MATESDRFFNVSREARASLLDFSRQASELFLATWNIRGTLEEIDRYYLREGNTGYHERMAKSRNQAGDKSKYRDFTVPIVMPQVEAAVGYLTNVFLTGYPIFGVNAGPGYSAAALQLETIFANHSRKARWPINLQQAFRDNLKYNLMGLYVDWDEVATWDITSDPTFMLGKQGKPVSKIWQK